MRQLSLSGRSIFALCATAAGTGMVVMACGSGDNSGNTFGDGGPGGGGDTSVNYSDTSLGGGDGLGGGSKDAYIDPDAFWAMDPPPMWCGPDGGGMPPPPPGGTPDCPSDKNREGCPCTVTNMTAPCWPGLRANRNLGVCKDGTTTCIMRDEFTKVWGPCMGYVLPTPGATTGKAACKCFSGGQWKIDNLSPCFVNYSPSDIEAVSTYIPAPGQQAQCPATPGGPPPMPQPGTNWSTDTVTTDCAGHFKLCYTLKAGMGSAPQPSDCVVSTVCTEADYTTANMPQAFPPLPSWVGMNTACATQFANTGGYGEMSVIGESVLCDKVDDGMGNPLVFNRVQYCPLACSMNPMGPGCANCMQGGSGMF